MKMRLTVTAALLVCLAATSFAAVSPQYADWGKGPYQFLMTKEEAAAWKSIQTDEAAKAFVDLFWARRDPTPGTPANEYRAEIEARIAAADKGFAERRGKGSMTDRGKALLLYGQPKRMERSGTSEAPEIGNNSDATDATKEIPSITWVYEDATTKELFGVSRAGLKFSDRFNSNEYKFDRSGFDLNAAAARAIAKAITQPNLTSAPAAAAAAPATPAATSAPAPTVPAAPAVVTELSTDALKSAVAELKSATKNPYADKAYATWGEYVTSTGTTFVPVGLYVPKSAGISGSATFFGVVEDASGKSLLAFEQPATLVASKDDFFVDKSLMQLPAGKHRGIFGLAQNGKVVALTSTDLQLAGNLDKDATAISQLLLSNNVFPLTEAQKADDPFAFGGVRVVPKADQLFRTSDELWYFFELRNPGLPEVAEGAERLPKVQVKIDVAGTAADGKPVKMAAPPAEVNAIEMKGVAGHYAVGNAIPLASFKPGDYTFTIKVIDTLKKTSYTLSEKFKVVP
jgi:GWxTD domain-containing protein